MDGLFEVHMLNEEGKEKARNIARCFDDLLDALKTFCGVTDGVPASREFHITRTKLEEACFYAKKAMAMNPENQQPT